MDIKTADRLVELRKSHGFSQEALSEKLGVSRQAISKWERGESSPDTDNLIALANIYGITLDDILNPNKDIHSSISPKEDKQNEEITEKVEKPKKEKKPRPFSTTAKSLLKFPMPLIVAIIYVVINLMHSMWHPSWIIFVLIPIYYHLALAFLAKTKKGLLLALPVPEIAILIYLSLGFISGLWAKGTIVFIIIPLYYWSVAFYKKSK